MTHIEQAIKEAVAKGGYDDSRIDLGIQCEDAYDHYLLDPIFWRALGRAKGWGTGPLWENNKPVPVWKLEWHRFIDHLAEGGYAETFFAGL
jgi:hypothetical protein